MEKAQIEAIFFDFDGTLAETARDVVASWKVALETCGVYTPELERNFRIGPSVEAQVKRLFPDCKDQTLLNNLRDAFKKDYDFSAFPTTTAYACGLKLCKELAARGKKLYIVTNKRWYSTCSLSAKLGYKPFVAGIYSPDVLEGTHLDKPEFLKLAVRISGVDPEKCLMIGDTELDIQAGKAVGIKTCAVTWGYGVPETVAAANPDCYMHETTAIADFDKYFC